MYIAYSAINPQNVNQQRTRSGEDEPEFMLRLQAYQAVCEKYRREIIAIQKYLPGWVPPFYKSIVTGH